MYKILSRFLAGRPSEEGGEPPTSRVGLRGDVLSCLRKMYVHRNQLPPSALHHHLPLMHERALSVLTRCLAASPR